MIFEEKTIEEKADNEKPKRKRFGIPQSFYNEIVHSDEEVMETKDESGYLGEMM